MNLKSTGFRVAASSDTGGPTWGDLFSRASLLAFILGLSACYQINLIGSLSLQEMLFAIFLPFFVFHGSGGVPKVLSCIIWGLFGWLVVQFSTDIFRLIPFEDSARGCARIIFFGCGVLTLYFHFNAHTKAIGAFLFVFTYLS